MFNNTGHYFTILFTYEVTFQYALTVNTQV